VINTLHKFSKFVRESRTRTPTIAQTRAHEIFVFANGISMCLVQCAS